MCHTDAAACPRGGTTTGSGVSSTTPTRLASLRLLRRQLPASPRGLGRSGLDAGMPQKKQKPRPRKLRTEFVLLAPFRFPSTGERCSLVFEFPRSNKSSYQTALGEAADHLLALHARLALPNGGGTTYPGEHAHDVEFGTCWLWERRSTAQQWLRGQE